MKLIYQWIAWAYGHIACMEVEKQISTNITDIKWFQDFSSVWWAIDENNIWVIPFENSYAWNVHENLNFFMRYDYKIVWEINLKIDHCLLSKETDIWNIKEVYSHPQAISQCHDYLKAKNIKSSNFSDTAWASKMIKDSIEKWIWSIWAIQNWEIYWLNILDKNIQDQTWNTTRFFVICPKNQDIKLANKQTKTTIIFEAKNIPASLYKCLWAFATNNINLTKIESLPSLKWPFTYFFWIDIDWTTKDEGVQKALKELEFFTKKINILGEY